MRAVRHHITGGFRRTSVVVVLAVALSATACGSESSPPGDAGGVSGGETSTWLFSVLGASAEIGPPDASSGGQQVVLRDPGDVIAFTDRPERRAIRMSPANLVADWSELFASSPPNAVLTGITTEGEQVEVAVELTSLAPGTGDPLTFSLTTIGEDDGMAISSQLTEVAIFIDDVPCPSSTCLVYASTFIPFDSSF